MHNYHVKIPNFMDNFSSLLSLYLSTVHKKSTPLKFAYIWHFQLIEIETRQSLKKRESILQVTFSLLSPSLMLKLPIVSKQWIRHTLIPPYLDCP